MIKKDPKKVVNTQNRKNSWRSEESVWNKDGALRASKDGHDVESNFLLFGSRVFWRNFFSFPPSHNCHTALKLSDTYFFRNQNIFIWHILLYVLPSTPFFHFEIPSSNILHHYIFHNIRVGKRRIQSYTWLAMESNTIFSLSPLHPPFSRQSATSPFSKSHKRNKKKGQFFQIRI